jgi:hypothetical protein
MAQVRQDEVDAGLVVAGEQHAAVDDQQSAQMLENRHVAADFTDPAERGNPQSTRTQGTRRGEVYIHLWAILWLTSGSPEHRSGAHVGGQSVDLFWRRGDLR